MSFYEPNPDVQPTGDEPAEYVDDLSDDPAPPTSSDPTGEGRRDHPHDDSSGD
jgi:hypothetical protein